MNAISLWQPWASLVVFGHKKIETRHWHAPKRVIGKRIAIHAAQLTRYDHLTEAPPFDVLEDEELAHGCIVGTVVMKRCHLMTTTNVWQLAERNPTELAFGHYEPGRYAWVLSEPRALAEPVPCRGRQGFFRVDAAKLKGTIRA